MIINVCMMPWLRSCNTYKRLAAIIRYRLRVIMMPWLRSCNTYKRLAAIIRYRLRVHDALAKVLQYLQEAGSNYQVQPEPEFLNFLRSPVID